MQKPREEARGSAKYSWERLPERAASGLSRQTDTWANACAVARICSRVMPGL
jgi:hypothetical protein